MSFWDEWGNVIIGMSGLATTVVALNKDAISNKIIKNQDKRDASNTAVSASEQAVNIMQDVLDSVNAARAADKNREDECHKLLAQEREDRRKEYQELSDRFSRLEQQLELYRNRVAELETKYNI